MLMSGLFPRTFSFNFVLDPVVLSALDIQALVHRVCGWLKGKTEEKKDEAKEGDRWEERHGNLRIIMIDNVQCYFFLFMIVA